MPGGSGARSGRELRCGLWRLPLADSRAHQPAAARCRPGHGRPDLHPARRGDPPGHLRPGVGRGADPASRPEQRALPRYIFPGCELDDIGNTIALLEQARFEVHDVESWRDHYAQTTRRWCERLTANREKAVELVGDRVYRIWVAYLAGSSLAFARGSVRIYQTLARRAERGPPPATRADLYRATDPACDEGDSSPRVRRSLWAGPLEADQDRSNPPAEAGVRRYHPLSAASWAP